MKANESPEWLPKGWIVELKTHQSGSKMGKKFKVLRAHISSIIFGLEDNFSSLCLPVLIFNT